MNRFRRIRDYHENPEKYISNVEADPIRERAYVTMQAFGEVCGLRFLGDGHYSQVFQINNRYVLKRLRSHDTGYENYIAYALKNQDNPWVPRVRAAFQIKNYKFFVLEQLKRVETTDVRPMFDKWAKHIYDCPMLEKLVKEFGRANFNDVRNANVMKRANGQLVFTDPCARFVGLGVEQLPDKARDEPAKMFVPELGIDWAEEFKRMKSRMFRHIIPSNQRFIHEIKPEPRLGVKDLIGRGIRPGNVPQDIHFRAVGNKHRRFHG